MGLLGLRSSESKIEPLAVAEDESKFGCPFLVVLFLAFGVGSLA